MLFLLSIQFNPFWIIFQFFQNFGNLHFYYFGILVSGKDSEDTDKDVSFSEVMHFCNYYGKFATGASLFIHKAMCFTILVDSFNMHKVQQLSLMEPYNLLAIILCISGIKTLVALDLYCLTNFVKYFIRRLNIFTV